MSIRLAASAITSASALALVVLACGSDDNSSSSSSSSSGFTSSGSSGGDCSNSGCATPQGALRVHVVDGSNKPVPGVFFIVAGNERIAACVTQNADGTESRTFELDAGVGCEGEYDLALDSGKHTVEVRAAGFATQTLDETIPQPDSCCGQGPIVRRNVTMNPG